MTSVHSLVHNTACNVSIVREEVLMLQLRPYQEGIVQTVLSHQMVQGIFAEQRTGKTPVVISALKESNTSALIIVPNTLKYVWLNEWTKWAGKYGCHVINKHSPMPETGSVIINYEAFSRDCPDLLHALYKRRFDVIVLDEAHRIRNRNATTSKNIITLSRSIPGKIACTGTPAYNTVQDIWNILRFLRPEEYRSYWQWINKYCKIKEQYTPNGIVKVPDGIKPEVEQQLQEELSSFCTILKRKDVMQWCPEVPVVDVPLSLSIDQKRYLKQLRVLFECTDGTTTVETQSVIDRLVRYRQICNAPALLGLKGNSPKLMWVAEFIKDNPNKQILIFSNSRKTLELFKYPRIDGHVSPTRRAEMQHHFQNGDYKVMCCQTQACKEGLTLDQADVAIFLDLYPPMADFLQAKDRLVATSEDRVKDKVCYRLFMSSSFDEVMVRLVDHNKSITDVINNFKGGNN